MFNWINIISLIKCPYNSNAPVVHSHSFYQLVYVLEGKGSINYMNEIYEVEKNDIFLIGCHQPHGIYGKNMLAFEFKFGVAHDYYREMLDKTVKKEKDCDNKIRRMIERIENEIEGKEKFYIDFIKLEFSKILLTYIKESEGHDSGHLTIEDFLYKRQDKKTHFGEVVEYIKENYAKKITLEELSNICCMGVSGFIKKFKQIHGMSPMQYVNKIRFLKGKEMLKNTGMSITEVAEKSGFGSLHYFSRYFAKHTGITPKDFRDKSMDKYTFNIDLPL